MADLWDNPLGTDGFEFVEYASRHPQDLEALFSQLGFIAIARHRSKHVTLYRQGGINFILNAEPVQPGGSLRVPAWAERERDGLSREGRGRRVEDPRRQGRDAGCRGAGPMELQIPAIEGIGGSLIYLVDRYEDQSIYDVDFKPIPGVDQRPTGVGLTYATISPTTSAREHGQMGGLLRASLQFQASALFRHRGEADRAPFPGDDQPLRQDPHPDQRVRPTRKKPDRGILQDHNGEGIQHIAMGTDDIYATGRRCGTGASTLRDTPTPITKPSTSACRSTARTWHGCARTIS